MARQDRVNETVGIPMEWIMEICTNEQSPLRKTHMLATEMSLCTFDALVTLARATDTPDAFDMGTTWARTRVVDTRSKWKARAAYRAALAALPGGEMVDELERVASSVLWKRERGATVNPTAPDQHILFFWSTREQAGAWFDTTASNDPPRSPRCPAVVPRPRPGRFWLDVPTDHPARYASACRYCCNRTLREGKRYQKCSTCFVARYCSRACQVADWPAHKGEECKRLSLLLIREQ